jgi:bifunctional enzyme CysN/CysC
MNDIVSGVRAPTPPGDDRNVTAVPLPVSAAERARANGHRAGVLWLTGLPGAGKSTLAMALLRQQFDRGRQIHVLDGDNLRRGLNRDLGFAPEARAENIRRVAEVARLFADAGIIVVTALISPMTADRALARSIVGDGFHEVYVKADVAVCVRRDPKGLYARARAGQIPGFTGVSAPYEPPAAPDLVIDTGRETVEQSLARLAGYIERAFRLARPLESGTARPPMSDPGIYDRRDA